MANARELIKMRIITTKDYQSETKVSDGKSWTINWN